MQNFASLVFTIKNIFRFIINAKVLSSVITRPTLPGALGLHSGQGGMPPHFFAKFLLAEENQIYE